MNDGPEWFAPKRYGYGAGLPITWQGWLVLIGYLTIVVGLACAWDERPLQLFAVVIPLTVALVVITARTTRGGWHWRWGNRD